MHAMVDYSWIVGPCDASPGVDAPEWPASSMTMMPSLVTSPGVRTLPNVPLLSPEVAEPRA